MLPSYVCLHVTAMCRPVFRPNPAWHVFDIVLASMCMILCDEKALQDFLYNTRYVGFWPWTSEWPPAMFGCMAGTCYSHAILLSQRSFQDQGNDD